MGYKKRYKKLIKTNQEIAEILTAIHALMDTQFKPTITPDGLSHKREYPKIIQSHISGLLSHAHGVLCVFK